MQLHDFLTQILNFFKLLVKDAMNISCAQITPSHKCDKNQLCNTITNTVKHTISIIISLLFSLNLTHEPSRLQKYENNFFSKICLLLSHYRALKDNKQTNHTCNFF